MQVPSCFQTKVSSSDVLMHDQELVGNVPLVISISVLLRLRHRTAVVIETVANNKTV